MRHPEIDPDLLERAARALEAAKHPVAFTGAGISVPSGIPDFRSPGGLWSRFDPIEVASLTALRTNPHAVWEFLLSAVSMFDSARPNPAHEALARLEACGRLRAVITQNIDGLHQAAGSREVIEFHGGCTRFYCMSCALDHDPAQARALSAETIPWRCECGGVVRPNVVFFGEGIPTRAMQATEEHLARADLVLVVGTSGDVSPANTVPLRVKHRGGTVIEINLGETAFARVSDIRFDASAKKVLPELASLVCPEAS